MNIRPNQFKGLQELNANLDATIASSRQSIAETQELLRKITEKRGEEFVLSQIRQNSR